MSTSAEKIPLAVALEEARAFRALFAGCYDRWEFAGSLRRGRSYCGDIEHVVIPIEGEASVDLFGNVIGRADNLMRQRIDALLEATERRSNGATEGVSLAAYGKTGSNRNGDRYTGLSWHGRKHEIFMCGRENWGVIYQIRTGSGDFNPVFQARLRKNGYRTVEGQLFKELAPGDAVAWSDRLFLADGTPAKLIDCPDEATYFAAAGYDSVIDPAARE